MHLANIHASTYVYDYMGISTCALARYVRSCKVAYVHAARNLLLH